MKQITKRNHYIPQALLKNWSLDGNQICAYRTLVSHEKVNEWNMRSISESAYQFDLYTNTNNDVKEDNFERWIKLEFEDPGILSIRKALKNQKLGREDWAHMIRFLAVQDVRTPLAYLKCRDLWDKEMPNIIEDTIDRVKESIDINQPLKHIKRENNNSEIFNDFFKVKISPHLDSSEHARLHIEATTGRAYWLAMQEYLLKGIAKQLLNHKWSLVSPAKGYEWPITDRPVIKLNYHNKNQFDFEGGWGSPGTEILMPISPFRMLYTRVGHKIEPRRIFSQEITQELVKVIIKSAHRWIFSRRKISNVSILHPRKIDANMYNQENQKWKDWHNIHASNSQ